MSAKRYQPSIQLHRSIGYEQFKKFTHGMPLGGLGLPLAEGVASGEFLPTTVALLEAFDEPILHHGIVFAPISLSEDWLVPLELTINLMFDITGIDVAASQLPDLVTAVPYVAPISTEGAWVCQTHLIHAQAEIEAGRNSAPAIFGPGARVRGRPAPTGDVLAYDGLRRFLGSGKPATAVADGIAEMAGLTWSGEGPRAINGAASASRALADALGLQSDALPPVDARVGRLMPLSLLPALCDLALGHDHEARRVELLERLRDRLPTVSAPWLGGEAAWSEHVDLLVEGFFAEIARDLRGRSALRVKACD